MTKEKLGELILKSERQFYSTAKSILCDDQDCADAISETIVKAFSKLHTLRADRYAKTWLIRILLNECYSILRKQSKQVSVENIQEYLENSVDKMIQADLVENRMQMDSDYEELYQALSALKDELRLPMILYYIDEYSIKEIAQILEISEGAVQKRLARAREKMRRTLQSREAFV